MAENATDGFRSKWGFILSSIGTAVGMGNIWRFPIMVSKYGGLTFLLPYFLFIAFITMTGVMEEFSLGRATGSGPVNAFGTVFRLRGKKEAVGRGIGMLPIVGALGLGIGYLCVVAWILKYTVMAVTGALFDLGQDLQVITDTFNATASANGATPWLLLVLLICLLIMSFRVSKGIEKTNKLMMPMLFVIFMILCVYIFTLDGSSEGYRYLLSFRPAGLADPNIWIFAFGQAFFSLSVAGNASIVYGAYLSKKESILFSSVYVAVFDTLAALLAAFSIIPAMALSGSDLSEGGPGLMFIHLVRVFNAMPGGKLVGILFFVAVLFAGITSLIGICEAPVALIREQLGLNRFFCVLTVLVLSGTAAFFIQSVVPQWMDIISIYICPFGAFLAGVVYFWIAGKEFANDQVSIGGKKKIGKWFYPLGKYVFCPLALAAFVLGIVLGGIG